ncbi:MAG TPA: AAA family ATPase, partial [Victivallales bacterium]|nr:AAA family ATPase [Victivallales bacterium]
QEICISGKDIPYIDKVATKILSAFSKENMTDPKIDPGIILKKLSPEFDYGIAIADKIKISESKILRLTEQQCELLDFISSHKKALIRGCAGSGKTVLAVKKAREIASEGKKVLLLVYNSMLCEKILSSVSDVENIIATTFHDLCIKHLQDNGIQISPQRNDDKAWTETIPKEFLKILKTNPLKFDAVIVDEAQDFRENYWDSVTELVKTDAYFYIFYDPDQNLFNKELSLPKLGTPFNLDKNCRNTTEIFKTLKPYCTGNIRISDDAPVGTPVTETRQTEADERRKTLNSLISQMISEGIFERQIVILGGHSMSKTCIGEIPNIGDFEIVENGSPDIGKIPYFTYMKFKGCEADAVILLDVSESDPRWNKEALCTAISRAKYVLHIIRK